MHGFQLLGFRKVHSTPRELGKSEWRDTRGYRQDFAALIQISILPVLLCAWILNATYKNCDFSYLLASSLFSSLFGIWQNVHIHETVICIPEDCAFQSKLHVLQSQPWQYPAPWPSPLPLVVNPTPGSQSWFPQPAEFHSFVLQGMVLPGPFPGPGTSLLWALVLM